VAKILSDVRCLGVSVFWLIFLPSCRFKKRTRSRAHIRGRRLIQWLIMLVSLFDTMVNTVAVTLFDTMVNTVTVSLIDTMVNNVTVSLFYTMVNMGRVTLYVTTL
jgi:hypothetical protein